MCVRVSVCVVENVPCECVRDYVRKSTYVCVTHVSVSVCVSQHMSVCRYECATVCQCVCVCVNVCISMSVLVYATDRQCVCVFRGTSV